MAQNPPKPASNQEPENWDPAYLASLRELWLILVFFGVMLAWTIGVSFYLGYPADRDAPVELWRGVPKWFVLGVALPWAFATIVSIGFALFGMIDHDPPETGADAEPAKEPTQ